MRRQNGQSALLRKLLSQAYVLAKPKAKSIKEGATLITAAIQKRIKQDERSSHYVDDLELPDLTKVWPHPHLDGQCLEVEWEHPGDIIIGIYAWLPEYAHAQAESRHCRCYSWSLEW